MRKTELAPVVTRQYGVACLRRTGARLIDLLGGAGTPNDPLPLKNVIRHCDVHSGYYKAMISALGAVSDFLL